MFYEINPTLHFQVVQSLRLQSSSKSYSELGSCPTLSGNNRPLLARTIPSKVRRNYDLDNMDHQCELINILSVRRRVIFAANDGGDGADRDGADLGGEGGRPEEAGHRHLPRPRAQLSLQLLGEKLLQLDSESGYGFVYSLQ